MACGFCKGSGIASVEDVVAGDSGGESGSTACLWLIGGGEPGRVRTPSELCLVVLGD